MKTLLTSQAFDLVVIVLGLAVIYLEVSTPKAGPEKAEEKKPKEEKKKSDARP